MHFRQWKRQRVCGPGDIVVIPGGTEHEGWFREDTDRLLWRCTTSAVAARERHMTLSRDFRWMRAMRALARNH